MGKIRACIKYKKTSVGLRCDKFSDKREHPVCWPGLVDGGRSPGLIRPHKCETKAAKKIGTKRKVRTSTKRKAGRSRRGKK